MIQVKRAVLVLGIAGLLTGGLTACLPADPFPEAYYGSVYTDRLEYAPVWDDVRVNLGNQRPPAGATPPSYVLWKGSEVPSFSQTIANTLYFGVQLPHDYAEGTAIEFHLHIAYPTADTGDTVWTFTYTWANIFDPFPDPATVGPVVVAAPGVAGQHDLVEVIESIPGAGKEVSSILLCSITRNGNNPGDTYPAGAYGLSGDFHYQKTSPGTDYQHH